MNTQEAILKRRSIRKYTDREISEEDIHDILEAAMSGPSAVNARDWCFIVINDKEELRKWAANSGRASKIMEQSALSILICADTEKSFSRAPEYWVINGAIAGQNMILSATDKGIGSVWLGIWPQMDKVEMQKEYFHLPDSIIPHSIICFGYPDEEIKSEHVTYEEGKVHFNKW